MYYEALILPLLVIDFLFVRFLIFGLHQPRWEGLLAPSNESIEAGPKWLVAPRKLLKIITFGASIVFVIACNLLLFLGWDRMHITLVAIFAVFFVARLSLGLTDQYIRNTPEESDNSKKDEKNKKILENEGIEKVETHRNKSRDLKDLKALSLFGLPLVMFGSLVGYSGLHQLCYMGIGLGTGILIGFVLHFKRLGKRCIVWLVNYRYGNYVWGFFVFFPSLGTMIILHFAGYEKLILLPIQIWFSFSFGIALVLFLVSDRKSRQ